MILLLFFVFYLYLLKIIRGHCDLLIDDRSECGYPGISKVECLDRNCCWLPFSPSDLRNPPWCTMSASNTCGYSLINPDLLQDRCNKSRTAHLSVTYPYKDVLRVKISRSLDEFQIPDTLYPTYAGTNQSDHLRYQSFVDKNGNFNFRIIRNSSLNESIWDTNLQDNQSSSSIKMKYLYTQVGSILPPNHAIFGLGYHAGKLRVPPGNRLALFARDSPTVENQNLYSSHPFYLQIQNGKAHGMYLRNSFGMDVDVDERSIKFKMLGGPIDLFFLAGPTPLDVMEQYTRIIGRPAMFDYRVLGFHQSRYGYKNISQISRVADEYEKAQIPLDTIWFDIDYMEGKKDFTIDRMDFPEKETREFIKKLLDSHRRLVPILDPGIKIDANYSAYTEGIVKDIFIKNPSQYGDFYVGEVWPGRVHFIDFAHENVLNYWKSQLQTLIRLFDKNVIGGLWLDMNEPSNFIDGYNYTFSDLPNDYSDFSLNFPRYAINNDGIEAPIYKKTVPMDCRTNLGAMYQTHNLYGLYESIVSYKALLEINPGTRPFLLTRSTFPGSGQWTATWLGDNLSTFPQMALSISGVLQYGLAGIPMSGPDICGFIGNATEELCARWMALGSFYPFARNHNAIDALVDQEPFRWKSVTDVSKKYLALRYSLLPFYYTLMHVAHEKGWPIIRPVFFYDNSVEALDIDNQFFLGSIFLVSPVLLEALNNTIVRLPEGEWYEWESLNFIKTSNSIKIHFYTPLNIIPIHLKAGSIVVIQQPKLTMYETQRTEFTVLIAFNSEMKASGQLYWDDGVSLNVGDDYLLLELYGKISNDNTMKFGFTGHFGLVECPLVLKFVILTAGKEFNTSKHYEHYNLIPKDSGFEVIFKEPQDLKSLNNSIIAL